MDSARSFYSFNSRIAFVYFSTRAAAFASTVSRRVVSLLCARSANFTAFELPLNYTNTGYKATHLRVMFASSNYASTNQAYETQNIVTVDNRGEAVSLGSELCVDNLSLIY